MATIFIGVPVPAGLLPDLSKNTAFDGLPLRWSLPENLHLTLFYMGPMEPAKVDKLKASLQYVALNHSAVSTPIRSLEGFPESCSRILALRCELTVGLVMLQERIRESIQSLSPHQDSHGFRPHITLARSRESRAMPSIAIDTGIPFCIDKIVVYESQVGDKYRRLLELPLL